MREIDPNLIRAYVDGELPPEAAEEVRAQIEAHPQWRALAGFERRLKSAVARTMADVSPAPASLEAAVRVAIREEAAEARETGEGVERETTQTAAPRGGLLAAILSLIEPVARPRPVSVGAVACVLAIAAGAVLFGVFSRPIDWLSPNQQADLAADPAEYASQEHERCARNPEWFERKVNVCSPLEAVEALTNHFGIESVTIFNLTEAGYEFVGKGRCDVPGSRDSAHLVYERRVEGKPPAKLSIFIAAAGADRPVMRCGVELTPGEWHRYREGSRCRKRVLLSTDNALVYFLVTCDPRDAEPAAEIVGRALAARAARK